MEGLLAKIWALLTIYGLKVIAAIAVFIVGRWIAKAVSFGSLETVMYQVIFVHLRRKQKCLNKVITPFIILLFMNAQQRGGNQRQQKSNPRNKETVVKRGNHGFLFHQQVQYC